MSYHFPVEYVDGVVVKTGCGVLWKPEQPGQPFDPALVDCEGCIAAQVAERLNPPQPNRLTTVSDVTEAALETLMKNLTFNKYLNQDYAAFSPGPKVGSTINVRKPPRFDR